MLKIGVLGSTKGTDLQAIIDAINSERLKDVEVVVVISNKKEAYILERARENNIEAFYIYPKGKTREEFDREIMDILDKKEIDLVILIGYMRLLSSEFVKKWENKVMNIHPSLLPAFAGGMDLDVHEAVIKRGCKISGCSLIFIDKGADTGPILIQKTCRVEETDTPETLKKKVQELEGEALIEGIGMFKQGKFEK